MTQTTSGASESHGSAADNPYITCADGTPTGYHRASYEAGWRAGAQAAVTWAAERADALDLSWRPVTRRTPEQVRADWLASLAPSAGWHEACRTASLRALRFVASPAELTPELVAASFRVSPLADCDWPTVAACGVA